MSERSWSCLKADPKSPKTTSILDVSVSPNAKKTELVGWHDGALRIRLNAPPVDGAANEALRKWLAKELGVPQNQISLLRGASNRRKQWQLHLPEAAIALWLQSHEVLQNS